MAIDNKIAKSGSSFINILGYIGSLTGIVSGLVYSVRLPGVSPYAVISLLIGIAFLTAYILKKKKEFFAVFTPRLNQELSSLIIVAFTLLALVIWAEAVSARYYTFFDFTGNDRNTLSKETRHAISNLKDDVKIMAFYSTKDKIRKPLRAFFDRYKVYSKRISYEFFDPKLSTGKTKKYGIAGGNVIVIESGKKKKILSSINEERLTNAILGVLKKGEEVVYFTKGHGESGIEDKGADGYDSARKGLEAEGFKVDQIYIHKRKIPKDTGLLIINGPKKEFTDPELSEIEGYVEKGGNVLFLIDPYTQKKISAFLKGFSIATGDGVIIDKSTRLFGSDFEMAVGSQYAPANQITRNFTLLTTFPHSRPVYSLDQNIAKVIAATGKLSWEEMDRELLEDKSVSVFEKEKDKRGPVPIAVFAESSLKKWRIAVIGDSDFANNTYLNLRGNRDFFLNTVNTLSGEENLVTIRPKDMNFIPLVLSSSAISIVFWFSVVAFPIIILAGGLFYLGKDGVKDVIKSKKTASLVIFFAFIELFSCRSEAGEHFHKRPLKGKVVMADFFSNPPLEGAKVIVSVDNEQFITETDKDGYYSLRFKPGFLNIRVEKQGFFPELFEQLIDEETKYPPLQATYLYKIPPSKGVFLLGSKEYFRLDPVEVKKRDIDKDTFEYVVDGTPTVISNPVIKLALYHTSVEYAKKMILLKVSGSDRAALVNRELDLMDYEYKKLQIKNTKVEIDFVVFAVRVDEPGRYLFIAIEGKDISDRGYYIETVN